ncbi:MAG: hypothetical protein SFX72_21510 [Isosphaeraceae bacterium]|nr:hypothetical protein [Isosphaeraceae bacterium]
MKPATWKWIGALSSIALTMGIVYMRALGKPASESIHTKIRAAVARQPELRASYDRALSDGKLSLAEAREILEESKALRNRPPIVPQP